MGPYGLEKWCQLCKRWLPRKGNFNKGAGADGTDNRCKLCKKQQQRERAEQKRKQFDELEQSGGFEDLS